ncbi:hypothetical protein [Harryflintia acetispora]|uniref:hypothetical protein n=1 Tax=Harryflintia acetispora TaxID=1849041 RepID=UPI001898BA29|nr:hypothetical protein [Harryflintia acetispora]
MDISDWRNRGQEEYLKGQTLIRKKFKSSLPKNSTLVDDPQSYNDHEHCDFCFAKIVEDSDKDNGEFSEGYCTLDGNTWICENCYNDFKNEFNWKVIMK